MHGTMSSWAACGMQGDWATQLSNYLYNDEVPAVKPLEHQMWANWYGMVSGLCSTAIPTQPSYVSITDMTAQLRVHQAEITTQ